LKDSHAGDFNPLHSRVTKDRRAHKIARSQRDRDEMNEEFRRLQQELPEDLRNLKKAEVLNQGQHVSSNIKKKRPLKM
jgi:hypothetical protein